MTRRHGKRRAMADAAAAEVMRGGRVLVVSGTMAGAEEIAALMPGETGRIVALASIEDDAATKAADEAALNAALVRWMMRGGAP